MLATAVVVATPVIAIAQTPAITATVASGTTVVVAGSNLLGTTEVTVGDVALTNVGVSQDGATVTGVLPSPLANGSYVLRLVADAPMTAPTGCSTVQPASDWVCIDGGWLPPNHPLAQQQGGNPARVFLSFVLTIGAGSGAAGPTGPAGPAGPAGIEGPAGAAGSAGAPGAPGAAGATGATGAQGPAGPQGAAGTTGAQGPSGPQGVIGPIGPQGPTGLTGPPVSFQGTWSNMTTYAAGDAVFFSGSSYISLSAGNLANTPASGAPWALLAEQGGIGPEGPQGPAGAQGPAGSQGLIGPAGVQGPAGPQGPPVAFQGIWSNLIAYASGDAVFFSGSSYISLSASNIGNTPTGGAPWALLAQQGSAGAAGGGSLTSFEWNATFGNGIYLGDPLFFSPNSSAGNDGNTLISFGHNNQVVVPVPCTVSVLSVGAVVQSGGIDSPDAATFTIYHNGNATAMTCTAVTDVTTGSRGSCTTTANTFAVVAGDKISLRLDETNFSPSYYYGTNIKCQ